MVLEFEAADLAEVDLLLGQPRMVADPRISTAQAAAILGLPPGQVRRLMARGELPVHGPPRSQRRLLLSQVRRLAALGEPITVGQAATILRTTTNEVRARVAAGQLTERPAGGRPVYRGEAENLARRLAVDQAARGPTARRGPAGHLTTSEAARILGLSRAGTRAQAAARRLPAPRNSRGQYWYRPAHLEMVARARRATELAELNRT